MELRIPAKLISLKVEATGVALDSERDVASYNLAPKAKVVVTVEAEGT